MTKIYNIYQVDSFTNKMFFGNPAGVVSNAEGLTEDDMQKIARELNNSETAFILPPNKKECDMHVRFFTPLNEVPICGHATVAAHFVRAFEENYIEDKRILQNTKAGILPIDITKVKDSYKVTMTQGKIEFGELIKDINFETLIKALGIKKEDLIENAPIQIVSTGHSKVMIGIKNYELIHNMKPNFEMLKKLSEKIKCNGYYVFTFDTNEPEILIKGRMFAPISGVNEDPVTGNANGPLGAYLIKYNLVKYKTNEPFKFIAKQGAAMGREGNIEVIVQIENNEAKEIKIAGTAVIVFKSQLTI